MHRLFAGVGPAVLLVTLLLSPTFAQQNAELPLSAAEREQLLTASHRLLESTPAPEPQQPGAVGIHSRRGDALLFLGRFPQAVREYQAMVAINPELDASHWRLGIALYLANEPEQAARQFDKYHSFDDVDRENGIWRFLCHYRAWGAERAAKELLKYSKDDREPFPVVYRLFDGALTPEEARRQIPESLSALEREKRVFYTELYIGLLETVRNNPQAARKALGRATACQWPRTAGFGPHYMWHVGRLQFDQLSKDSDQSPAGESAPPDLQDPTDTNRQP